MAWQKGQSGNPKGSKVQPLNTFRALCQRDVYLVYNRVLDIVKHGTNEDAMSLRAAMFILEGGYGKASQSIKFEKDYGDNDPSMMTKDQLYLAAQGRTEELIASLHKTGKLKEYLARLEEEPVMLESQDVKEEKEVKEIADQGAIV